MFISCLAPSCLLRVFAGDLNVFLETTNQIKIYIYIYFHRFEPFDIFDNNQIKLNHSFKQFEPFNLE